MHVCNRCSRRARCSTRSSLAAYRQAPAAAAVEAAAATLARPMFLLGHDDNQIGLCYAIGRDSTARANGVFSNAVLGIQCQLRFWAASILGRSQF